LGELVVAKYQLRAKPGLEEVSAAGGVTIVEHCAYLLPKSRIPLPSVHRGVSRTRWKWFSIRQ
jgi:hypothetical protein